MIFSDLYKGRKTPLAKLRSQKPASDAKDLSSAPAWLDKEYADLTSKDKTKQKDAIKRYMDAKVKNDWDFQWPAYGSGESPTRTPKKHARGQKRSWLMRKSSSDDAPPLARAADGTHDHEVDSGADLGGPSRLDRAEVEDGSKDKSLQNQGVDVALDDAHDDDHIDDDDAVSPCSDVEDTQSLYSVVSEDNANFRPRLEWASELSDDAEEASGAVPIPSTRPNADGSLNIDRSFVFQSRLSKQARRRRANREEMMWNEGLACFEARRDAWTGAKTVRVRQRPSPPPSVSPRSARCFFFPRNSSGSSSAAASPPRTLGSESNTGLHESSVTTFDAQSIAKSEKEASKHGLKSFVLPTAHAPLDQIPEELLPVETLLPLPHPILPPTNVLRASITPSVYIGLYDKVILNSLQPTCPINLSDMLKACVVGWKRDGEWPPQTKAAETFSLAPKKQQQQSKRTSMGASETMSTARRMSFGLLGRGEDESRTGKGIRRSLQKAFGFAATATGAEA